MQEYTQGALDLRLALIEIFTSPSAPPGTKRANRLILALRQTPDDAELHQRARDLLAVVELRRQLIAHRERAEQAEAPHLALVVHGLIGHADAELLGGRGDPGWRAAALDLLEPDGDEAPDPVDPATARRLFMLALGLDAHGGAPDDAAGE